MFSFDVELRVICAKYGIFPEDNDTLSNDYLAAFIEAWNQIPNTMPIAFYGLGDGFKHICARVDICSKNIVCIVENDSIESLFNDVVPVVPLSNIGAYKFEKIILTGFASKDQMRQDIEGLNTEIEIIDIYDILEKQGRLCLIPFFEPCHYRYIAMEKMRQKYKSSANREEAQKNLRLLIQLYIECRDFISADIYIQEYIEHKFEDSYSLEALRDELQSLLARIGDTIRSQKNRNVFVFVIDQLSQDRAMRIPFIKAFSKDSLMFTNAFSSAIFTRGSIFSFLTGKQYVDDGLYKLDDISREDSEFLAEMHARGIKVKYLSPAWLSYVEKLKTDVISSATSEVISLLYWNLLMDVTVETEDCIYFIHSLHETHAPFHSGNTSRVLLDAGEMDLYFNYPEKAPPGYFEEMELLIGEAMNYVGKQLEFYFSYIGIDKNTVIITSDHDSRDFPEIFLGIPITRDMKKIPLIVHSEHVSSGTYDEIYCNIDLQNIIRHLIYDRGKLVVKKMEYVRQEYEPFYNKALKLNAKEKPWIYGKIIFITDTDRYEFHLAGSESYYLLSGEAGNLIADERYKERIDFFRSKIKIDTRDMWKFLFEKYPRLLEVHKDRVEEFLSENKNPNALRGAQGIRD